MRDIDQFRQLMKGKTDSINTEQILPKAIKENHNN